VSAAAFDAGVVALIQSDATFVNGVLALIGSASYFVLEANTPIALIPAGEFPCFVIEQGDGQGRSISNDGSDGGMVIGAGEQQFASTIDGALIWKDLDKARAKTARATLPTLVTQLLLRNPQPGGIAGAWLEAWQPDRAANHPLHIWRFTLRGEYSVPRA